MFFKNTRHICLESPYQQPRLLENHLWYDNLRSLKVISKSVGNIKLPCDLFLKLKSMRVLDLSRLGLEKLPSSVMHMRRLRYLNISGNDFIKLPDSLTALFILQILILDKCDKLRDLPSNMKEMISLQHLCFDMNQLDEMPPEFGKLINLQTLSAFMVGKTKGSGIGDLKNMKSLSGSLCIKNLENVRDMADAKEAMLHMKPFLDRLQLVWNGGAQNHHELILSALQPHENLKELVINNYDGLFLPTWLVGSQCKLSNINLHKCKYDHVLISLAKVKTLKTLTIEDVSSWKEVEQDFSGFPSLESLIIKNNSGLISWGAFCGARFPCLLTFHIEACPVLKNLPSLVGSSCLHSLEITKCPKILSLPEDGLPSSLKEFTISDCDILTNRCRVRDGADWAKIRLIPKIVIDSEVIPFEQRG